MHGGVPASKGQVSSTRRASQATPLAAIWHHRGMDDPNRSITFGLPVSDVEGAVRWYRALLGDVPQITPAAGVTEFEVLPNCWLQLIRADAPLEPGGIVRIGARDVRAAHERVRRLGCEPTAIQTVPGVISFFDFRDPYGNRLGYYQVL